MIRSFWILTETVLLQPASCPQVSGCCHSALGEHVITYLESQHKLALPRPNMSLIKLLHHWHGPGYRQCLKLAVKIDAGNIALEKHRLYLPDQSPPQSQWISSEEESKSFLSSPKIPWRNHPSNPWNPVTQTTAQGTQILRRSSGWVSAEHWASPGLDPSCKLKIDSSPGCVSYTCHKHRLHTKSYEYDRTHTL